MKKFEGIRYFNHLNSAEIKSNYTETESLYGVVYLEVDTT